MTPPKLRHEVVAYANHGMISAQYELTEVHIMVTDKHSINQEPVTRSEQMFHLRVTTSSDFFLLNFRRNKRLQKYTTAQKGLTKRKRQRVSQ